MSRQYNDLTAFLNQHDLGRYAELLETGGVDLSSLPLLTSNDFRELGLPLVARRRMVAAAATLAERPAAGRVKTTPHPGERRRLTVIFCDLVGSTELSVRLDPEDFADLVQHFTLSVTGAVERFDGHVAKILGDGVLACFGYPHAHEDDAERAVLASLDCLETISRTPFETDTGERIPVRARIGIHTGTVVVTAPGADGVSVEELMGNAPNVAQRIQVQAAPGEILTGDRTRGLAGDRFDYDQLEPRWLKGVEGPMKLYRVRRENPSRTRFDIRNNGTLTPLVGRQAEVDRLIGIWRETVAGRGRSVLVSGPAGIGKSRVSRAFLDGVRSEPKALVTLQCSPHHMGTPLFPVISRLSQHMDDLVTQGCANRAEALAAWLDRAGMDDPCNRALAASLLSIDLAGTVAPLDMSPRQKLEETLLLLVDHAEAVARHTPVLLWVEDCHWADPTTLSLLRLCQHRLARARIMMLVTFRAEREPPPHDRFDTHLELAALAAGALGELIDNAARPAAVPDGARQTIIRRSEGLPLFAEELTKSVVRRLESSSEGQAGAEVPQNWEVPESLVDSLAARLDALPTAKQLAQVAAAIGREVDRTLLRRVSGYGRDRFDRAIAELFEAQMIRSPARSDPERLIFGHALIQDVAYQLMLRRDRRAIHARIVEVMEQGGGDMPPPLPEVLAHHFEAAQQPERAAQCLLDAGLAAVRRSANTEALVHLERALKLVTGKTRISRSRAMELELQIRNMIGTPLIATHGYTSKATVRAFQRAEEIALELGDDPSRFHALFGLWGYRWMAGHLDRSLGVARDMLDLAERIDADEALILAHRCVGSSHWIMGDFDRALAHLDWVIGKTIDTDTSELAGRYAVCPCVVAQVLGGYGMWLQGRREEGLRRVSDGLARAQSMNHAYSLALAHSMLGGLAVLSGDQDALGVHAEALCRIGKERRFPYWLHYGQMLWGLLVAQRGDVDAGRVLIEAAIEAYDAMGVFIHRTVQLVLLSEIARLGGDLRAARDWLEEARALGNRTGERQWFGVIDDRLAALFGPRAVSQPGR
ncbi:AAA family ATPase [Jhaorihella thermophila]|uniref:SAM domain (Sterile alpha motif) n=1 Tax=Jhaorihella thermophila TaxID=488547 RepID=A0A1H5UKE0_9RHOB|nr:AAA family ATPase [Jhaorihella thermophila]SEF75500.1 SAM domain (Sterile alpha motif) [Jhaorihella thermophila]